MTATAAQIATVRRMVDEPTTTTYSDVLIAAFIEAQPLMDELGTVPYTWSIATDPPSKIATPGWIPTYDLNAAAADIWSEKAAAVAEKFSFSADGGNYQAGDQHTQYMKMVSFYRSRRSARAVPLYKGI
jgi:hypothetical protein